MARPTHKTQRDFSGGEISTRMLMRADTEIYQRSVIGMLNFVPTLQGTAERTPGSRFIHDTGETQARIIPFLTPLNEHAIVEFLPGVAPKLYANLEELLETGATPDPGEQPQTIRKSIVENQSFFQGLESWRAQPAKYTNKGSGDLGVWATLQGNSITMVPRVFAVGDKEVCTLQTNCEVDQATDRVDVIFKMVYVGASPFNSGYEARLTIGTTPGGEEIYRQDFVGDVGSIWSVPTSVDLKQAGFTGTLYLTVRVQAILSEGEKGSTPIFSVKVFDIKANGTADFSPDSVLGGAIPYTGDQLKDLHYVQSPYEPRELVVTHPAHPPHMLLYSNGSYRFIPIVFTDGADDSTIPDWETTGNYPRTCTSYHGRLVLAGSNAEPILGAVAVNPTETVWATEVGEWNRFTDTDPIAGVIPVVTAKDSIEFNTIYRSPIQWVHGQKALHVGALNMEYVASAETVFQPADIGVEMHSTHGSRSVQPVGMGQQVMFAAEAGTKVRAMQLSNQDGGYVAPDMTLMHPELCASGIVRMARMRNPHQMVVVVLESGQIALFHQDSYAGIAGWSRVDLGDKIVDACVQSTKAGLDVLYLLVQRTISDVVTLTLEAISDWQDAGELEYLSSAKQFNEEVDTDTLTGLEHLEGRLVHVMGDDNFLGTYEVTAGQIVLVNEIGQPILVRTALVGLAMTATIITLPQSSEDEGAPKRFTDVSVRVRGSTRPFINGERPDVRHPITPMGDSQPLEFLVNDLEVSSVGWDTYQLITIHENVPFRCEILGIYGKLASGNL